MSIFYEMWNSGWFGKLMLLFIALLIAFLIAFVPIMIWKMHQFNERCEAENGWVLTKYKSSFCLSEDGKILF